MVPLILKQWTLTYGTLKIFIKKGKPHTYFCFAFLKKNKDFDVKEFFKKVREDQAKKEYFK